MDMSAKLRIALHLTRSWRFAARNQQRSGDLVLGDEIAFRSLLIPGASGASTSPLTIFCFPPDSM